MDSDRSPAIDLAHTADFNLGDAWVRPSRRQLTKADGKTEIVQPKVMQVLVALARARGEIVTRDELTESCWEGRIVGEDAINRVISQLRRLATDFGEGSFSIQTVARVGYRIVAEGVTPPSDARESPSDEGEGASFLPSLLGTSRRRLIAVTVGAAAFTTVAVGAVLWFERTSAEQPPSREAAALLDQAMLQLLQRTRDGGEQAIGLLQNLTAKYPNYADGWSLLSFAYASEAHLSSSIAAVTLRTRAQRALNRSRALISESAFADVAEAAIPPTRGFWLASERSLRAGLKKYPDNLALMRALADVLCDVGRHSEAVALYETVRRRSAPTPGLYFLEIMSLWCADRMEETDRLVAEAIAIYPTEFALWFAHVYTLMYSGRAPAAVGIIQDLAGRPSGIPASEFDRLLAVAQALATRDPEAIDAVMKAAWLQAKQGAGHAENAIQYASAFARIDDAFAIAEAYYFNTGFVVPEVRFAPEQNTYTPLNERETPFLFAPSTAAMRADKRFSELLDRIGLTMYWRNSGSRPDFLALQ